MQTGSPAAGFLHAESRLHRNLLKRVRTPALRPVIAQGWSVQKGGRFKAWLKSTAMHPNLCKSLKHTSAARQSMLITYSAIRQGEKKSPASVVFIRKQKCFINLWQRFCSVSIHLCLILFFAFTSRKTHMYTPSPAFVLLLLSGWC